MESTNHRIYRRELKQKLFAIRRHIEGEDVVLTKELKDLKTHYESLSNFTSWSDFPERWDIGDPMGVKKMYLEGTDKTTSDVDKRNYERLQGVPYEKIVLKESEDPKVIPTILDANP
jgi:hypothetical protein